MRLSILAIGQMKKGPDAALCDDYLHRLGHQGRSIGISDVRLKEFAESKHPNAPDRKAEESDRMTAAVPGQARIVALSERGRQMSSKEFAAFLQNMLDDAVPELAFMIGGPDGHHPALEEQAYLHLSFGEMTWPHRLARVMLSEQIYRAVTILTNHPYHRA